MSTRKRSRKVEREEEVETPSTIALESPEMERIRKELSDVITELIWSAHDVTFCLAELECENKENCELVKKTRELIKQVRKLFEIQRRFARR